MKHLRNAFFSAAIAAGQLTACSSSAEPAKPQAPAKLHETVVELEGLVELKGSDTLYKLADGRVYKLEGSLVRMIRGVYKGKNIKTAGRIAAEPTASAPGRYVVREVIVILQ